MSNLQEWVLYRFAHIIYRQARIFNLFVPDAIKILIKGRYEVAITYLKM